MPNSTAAWVYTLTREDIVLTREFVHEFAKKMEKLDLSRQKSTNWLDRQVFHKLDRSVHLSGGEPFVIHRNIIDEAYDYTDEYRWNTDVKRFAREYPKRAPNRILLSRLRLWELAFKVDNNPIILKTNRLCI